MSIALAVSFLALLAACGLGPALRGLPPGLAPHAPALAPAVGLALAIHLLLAASLAGVPVERAALPVLGLLLAASALLARGRTGTIGRGETAAACLALPVALMAGGLLALARDGGTPRTLASACYDPILYASATEHLRTRSLLPIPHWPGLCTRPFPAMAYQLLDWDRRLGPPLVLGWFGSLVGLGSFELFTILQAVLLAVGAAVAFVGARAGLGLPRPLAVATTLLVAQHPLVMVAAADGFQGQLLAIPLLAAGLLVAHAALLDDPEGAHLPGLALAAALQGALASSYLESLPYLVAGLAGIAAEAGYLRGRAGLRGTLPRVLGLGMAAALLAAPSCAHLAQSLRDRWLEATSGRRAGFPLVGGWPLLAELPGYGLRAYRREVPARGRRTLSVLALVVLALGARRARAPGLWVPPVLVSLLVAGQAFAIDYAYVYHKAYSMALPYPLALAGLGAAELLARLRVAAGAGGARGARALAGLGLASLALLVWVGGGVLAGWTEAQRFADQALRVSPRTEAWKLRVAADPSLTRVSFPPGFAPDWDALWIAYWMRDRDLWFEWRVLYLAFPGGPPPDPHGWVRALPDPDGSLPDSLPRLPEPGAGPPGTPPSATIPP